MKIPSKIEFTVITDTNNLALLKSAELGEWLEAWRYTPVEDDKTSSTGWRAPYHTDDAAELFVRMGDWLILRLVSSRRQLDSFAIDRLFADHISQVQAQPGTAELSAEEIEAIREAFTIAQYPHYSPRSSSAVIIINTDSGLVMAPSRGDISTAFGLLERGAPDWQKQSAEWKPRLELQGAVERNFIAKNRTAIDLSEITPAHENLRIDLGYKWKLQRTEDKEKQAITAEGYSADTDLCKVMLQQHLDLKRLEVAVSVNEPDGLRMVGYVTVADTFKLSGITVLAAQEDDEQQEPAPENQTSLFDTDAPAVDTGPDWLADAGRMLSFAGECTLLIRAIALLCGGFRHEEQLELKL